MVIFKQKLPPLFLPYNLKSKLQQNIPSYFRCLNLHASKHGSALTVPGGQLYL